MDPLLSASSFAPRSFRILGVAISILCLGGLGATLAFVLYRFLFDSSFGDVADGFVAAGPTLIYATVCAVLQVTVGLILAISIQSISRLRKNGYETCETRTDHRISLRGPGISRGDPLIRSVSRWPKSLFPQPVRAEFWLALLFESLCIAAYTMQPYLLSEVFIVKLGMSAESIATLFVVSIWQFAPFSMVFFIDAFDRAGWRESGLVALESKSHLRRWIQVYWPRIRTLFIALVGLRFCWMIGKFDVPYAISKAWTQDRQLISLRLHTSSDLSEACFWGGILLSILTIAFAARTLTFRIVRRWNIGAWWLNARTPDFPFGSIVQRGVDLFPWLIRPLAILLILGFLTPIFVAAYSFIPDAFGESLARLKPSLCGTALICGSAALIAGCVATLVAHLAERGSGILATSWHSAPKIAYAVPLILLSFFSLLLVEPVGGGVELLLSGLKETLRKFGISNTQIAEIRFALPSIIVAIFTYTLYAAPFAYLVVRDSIATRERFNLEKLALVDGSRPGISFLLRIVFWPSRSAVLHASFFAFVINWQDLAIPLRLQTSRLEFFSFKLKQLKDEGNAISTDEVMGVALLISLALAMMYSILTILLRNRGESGWQEEAKL